MHADLVMLQRGRSIRQIRRLQHRVAVATRVGGVAVVAAVLTLGAWLGSRQQTQYLRAAEKEVLADPAASTQVAESLGEMIRGINAAAAGGRDMTQVREILDKYAKRIGPELKPHPRIEVELRTALAGAYCGIHEYERAEMMYQKAIALHQQHSLEQNPAQADLLLKLIRLYEATGRPEHGLEWKRKLTNLRSTTSSNSIPPAR
jgi:tetratricopeptide (TPR) repeat protein